MSGLWRKLWRPRFKTERLAHVERSGRVLDADALPAHLADQRVIAIDLGFGREFWLLGPEEFRIERDWLIPEQGRLLVSPGGARAIAARLARRGIETIRMSVRYRGR